MSEGGSRQRPDFEAMLKSAGAPIGKGITRMEKFLAVALSGLGIGRRSAAPAREGVSDKGTRLAYERTDLALERTGWAAERTLMAWIRTALSMISFGFTIGKVGQALHDVEVKGIRGIRVVGVESIAGWLVTLGTFALVAAMVQYSVRMHALHEEGLPRQVSIPFVVGGVLALLGGFALSSLVMEL